MNRWVPSGGLHNLCGSKTAQKHDGARPANVGGVTETVSSAKRDTPETNTLCHKGSLWKGRLREKKGGGDAAAAAAAADATAAHAAATPVVQPAVSAETVPSAESLLEVLRYLSKRSNLQDVCDSKPTAAAALHSVLQCLRLVKLLTFPS